MRARAGGANDQTESKAARQARFVAHLRATADKEEREGLKQVADEFRAVADAIEGGWYEPGVPIDD